jgi:sugar transferase (PEP-CTERM system associated)
MGKIRLFGFYFPLLFLVLAATELCVITAAAILATAIRFHGQGSPVHNVLGPLDYRAVVYGCVLLISMAAMGLYQTRLREGISGQLVRLVVASLLGSLILATMYYAIPGLYLGRGVTALAFLFSLLGIAIIRLTFFRLVDLDSLKPRILVFGAGQKASWVLEHLSQPADRRGFRLIGFVDAGGPRMVFGDIPVFKFDEPLCEYVRRIHVDQIVVAVDDRRNGLPMPDLLKCRLAGIEVLELPTFFERETGTVALELTDPSWLVFGQGFHRGLFVRTFKRALDVLICAVLTVIFSPIVLLTMFAIKLEDGWKAPVIYSQIRVGEQGRHFRLYKLRSMQIDAERRTGARWAHQNDDRVTRVGRIIRKLRIDEIPQIFNVLRGDMSFVGPRPERPEFTQHLEQEIRYYRERCAVKPGVTGWAQLRYPYGASAKDAQEKLKYDLYYIKNQNVLFDILILLQTAEVMLFRRGAR